MSVEVERAEHAGSDANLSVKLRGAHIQCMTRIPSAHIAKWPPDSWPWMRFDAPSA